MAVNGGEHPIGVRPTVDMATISPGHGKDLAFKSEQHGRSSMRMKIAFRGEVAGQYSQWGSHNDSDRLNSIEVYYS